MMSRVCRVVAVLALLVAAVNLPSSAYAAQGIDFDLYCRTQFAGAVNPHAVLRSNNVYGWKCNVGWWIYNHDVDLGPDNMRNACIQQHGLRQAYYLNYNNPYTWRRDSRLRL